jgi:pimeloyl-ACP methyl ester carboxylesterase
MKYFSSLLSCIGFCVVASAQESTAQSESHTLVLDRLGVMFVGGQETEMPSRGGAPQTQISGQAMVHYLIPPKEKTGKKLPVIMIPGMGLTSYLYLSTPDGREGWATTFAKASHPVYVLDGPQNVVTGIELASFADADRPPRMMLWANEITWDRWGIGEKPGVPLANTRFPVEHIAQLHASMTPVIGGGMGGGRRGGGGGNSSAESVAIAQLLETTGPAILVVHSMGGGSGFAATRMKPDLVKAIVAVEVVGSPTDSGDIKEHFADKQLIGVYGDNFEMRRMQGRYEATVEMAKLISQAGGKAEVIRLPDMGINGNSHLLMQDNNNAEIARMILDRLAL